MFPCSLKIIRKAAVQANFCQQFFVNRSGQIKPEKHSCHPENATPHSMQRKILLKFKFEKRAIKMCPSKLRFLNVLKGTCFFFSVIFFFFFFFSLTVSSSLGNVFSLNCIQQCSQSLNVCTSAYIICLRTVKSQPGFKHTKHTTSL